MTDESSTESEAKGHSGAEQAAWFCNWLRDGAERVAQSMAPPESAAKHFREARLEILRGVRELIDCRIQDLSKPKSKGSRIVVE